MINNFLHFPFDLNVWFFGLCLFAFVFKYILVVQRFRRFRRRSQRSLVNIVRNLVNVSFTRDPDLLTLSLFGLCFGQFLWMANLFVSNNIKTTTVVVDTSQIVKNADDAFNSQRTLCMVEHDTEYQIATTSGERNVLRRLFEQKAKINKPMKGLKNKSHCLLSNNPSLADLDFMNIFGLCNQIVSFENSQIVTI